MSTLDIISPPKYFLILDSHASTERPVRLLDPRTFGGRRRRAVNASWRRRDANQFASVVSKT